MTQSTQAPVADENRLIAERRSKLDKMREVANAYPNDFRPDDHANDLQVKFDEFDKATLAEAAHPASVAGRMMLKRVMGKASFATLQDGSGRIQIYLDKNALGEGIYNDFKTWDIGDILAVEGTVFKTNKGELSVHATSVRLLAKSLRPLPDKFHGLADQEIRYRQRYVDLIMNDETRTTFLARSKAISSIRQFMIDENFLEVETPMLHPIPGGASAKPFTTHHNALDMEMYLRVAPELYLKRLIVGGFERVFEINRNFRNEGVSPRHNPEFTMMEFYAAYTDHNWLMDFTEKVIRHAAIAARGTAVIEYQGQTLDLAKPFDRLTITQAILKHAPHYNETQLNDATFIRSELIKLKVDVDSPLSPEPAWAPCSWPYSKRRPSPNSGIQPISSTTLLKSRHWRVPLIPMPS